MSHRRTTAAGLGLLALLGTGAAPPEGPGTEGTMGVGIGSHEQRLGGCGGAQRAYRVTEPLGHVGVRHTRPDGFAVSGELSVGVGRQAEPNVEPGDLTPPEEVELDRDLLWTGVLALRAGKHGRHIGAEVGPALLRHDALGDGVKIMPSAQVWAGKPSVAYAWTGIFAGPMSGAPEFFGLIGVGHRSRHVGASIGTSFLGTVGEVDVRVGQGMRMGLHAAAGRWYADQSSPDLRGMLRLTIDYGRAGQPAPPAEAR